jgi:hypothetical protein
MRNVTKVVLLACTALTALALASCEVIASTAGQDLSGDTGTEWVSLTPTKPDFGDDGTGTAKLTLVFNKAIAGLTGDLDAAALAELFTFECDYPVDFTEELKAEKVSESAGAGAGAVYTLTVGNIPATGGIALVTINKTDITPPSRAWSLNGDILPDEPDPSAGLILLNPNGGINSGVPAVGKLIGVGTGYVLPNPNGSGFEWQDAIPSITQPAPAARSFVNWNTKADGAGTPYEVGTTITEGITLYAQWTPVWTVNFRLNGGTGTVPAAQTVAAGAGTAFNLPGGSGISAPAHNIFWYWDTQADGVGTRYDTGTSYQPAGGILLYAKWTGDGSSSLYPIEISCEAELAAMANGLDLDYKLVDDIAINDWTPVGDETNAFTGSLEGNGKTITFSGTITATNEGYAGLFGFIWDGTVKNLNITGTVTTSAYEPYAGAVAGSLLGGAISNIKSTAVVNATATYSAAWAGGIVGRDQGDISNCWTTGEVTATATANMGSDARAGGIAGYAMNGCHITNCYAKGAIRANGAWTYAGGIVGATYAGGISNNVALNSSISSIGANSTYANRVISYDEYRTELYDCNNNWAISMSVTKNTATTTVSTGLQNDKDGANFGVATTKASWTKIPSSSPVPGPGWTIAANQGDANDASPWWWDGDHPALFWE